MTKADEISMQLYSLREYGDLDRQLAALAELGYKRVETVGGHLDDARSVRSALDRYGLAAPTGHAPLNDLRLRLDWIAECAQTIGMKEVFMPAVPPQDRQGMPAETWRALGEELGGMAERMARHGLAFGYHNHDWELVPYDDGTTPLQHLFAGAQGSALTFEADLAWIVRGGGDPLAWMEAQKDRLTAVHVKDLAPEGQNADEDGWADVGEGTLDWPALLAAARERGVHWIVLEHDKPSKPMRFASSSREAVLKMLG